MARAQNQQYTETQIRKIMSEELNSKMGTTTWISNVRCIAKTLKSIVPYTKIPGFIQNFEVS
jgi:hypothetical protein